jgi:signal transduction histidine kinase
MTKRTKPLIMVVDDLESHLKAIGNTLLNSGFEVTLAFNGKRAVEVAKNALPDLILLDIVMPEKDGFEVIQELRAYEPTSEIPIIFLTSQKDNEYLLKGFQLGAVDYIIKPANKEETIARVNTHLELRNARKYILEQNDKLKVLVEDKSEFLELASKDLKIPLNEIRGYLDLINQFGSDVIPKEVKEYIDTIDRITKSMANVINDLLLLNDIEAGNVSNIFKSIDINLIIAKMIKYFENLARSKRISMSYDSNISAQTIVIADQEKLEMVFTRLLANTLRFSKAYKGNNSAPWSLVAIRTKNTIINNKEFVLIEIEDQGSGMTKDELQNAFAKFSKITVQNNANEATSLETGLSVVKALIESMDGRITIDSKPNVGTIVRFTLPLVRS